MTVFGTVNMLMGFVISLSFSTSFSCPENGVMHPVMVQTGTNDSDQLTARVDHQRVRPLIITPVLLLRVSLHLSRVVGSQGQTLKTTMSGHRPRGDEIVQRQAIKGTEHTPWTLDSLVNRLG